MRDVVEHAIETERDFLTRHGFEPGEPADLADPATAWRAPRQGRRRDPRPATGVAEREYDGYFGRTTIAATMADFYGWDLVIHGSDVARATGQPWSISDEEAATCTPRPTAGATRSTPRVSAVPRCPVPDDASATDRLLARLGRDPEWRPAP